MASVLEDSCQATTTTDGGEASGSSDWKSLGDTLEFHLLSEAEKLSLARAHKFLKAKSSVSTDWSFLYSEDEIAVYRKKNDDYYYAGEGVIDMPLHQVAELVKDVESSHIWEKFLVEARCIKVISASESCIDYIGYERFQTTGCLYTFRRDMLYFNRCVYRDGKYIQSQMSVEDAECPRREKTQRIDVKKGTGFILEPFNGDDSKTWAAFYFNLDLKGLPRFVKSRILRHYPLVIRDLRQHFASSDPLSSLIDERLQSSQQQHQQQQEEEEGGSTGGVAMRSSRSRACTCMGAKKKVGGSDERRGEVQWKSGVLSMQYDEPMPLDHYIRNETR